MSAREILATTYIEGHNRPIGHLHAKAIEVALTAAGFSIVHEDEIHAPSVERALPALKAAAYKLIADEHDLHLADAVEVNGWQWPDDGPNYIHGTIHQVLAALRELMKEVGR